MSLNFDIQSRAVLRAQVTKLYDKVSYRISEMSRMDKLTCISKLEKLSHDMELYDKNILQSKITSGSDAENAEFVREASACEEYSDKILSAKTMLSCDLEGNATAGSGPGNSRGNASKLKLPELPLPTYSRAAGESLPQFIRNLEAVLDKYTLSSYDRFIYLKKQLSGEPLILVDSLDESKQSYDCAKNLLQEAFASAIVQKYDAIKRLTMLKFNRNNPYEYVGEMRVLMDVFKNLDIKVAEVIQFFVWNSLSVNLQNHLITICNDNKPSLSDIDSNIFKAIDRLREVSTRSDCLAPTQSGVSTFASAVQYEQFSKPVAKSVFCSLCSDLAGQKDSSHSTRDCPKFIDVDSKLKRLESANACIRCGFLNHPTKSCTYKFRKMCSICGDPHMSFLCPTRRSNNSGNRSNSGNENIKEKPNKTAGHKQKSKTSVSSAIACASSVYQINVGSSSILPTFTCQIGSLKGVRAMKDSGCQPSFILSDIASSLNLEVVRSNHEVSVSGFNEVKNYITNTVKVPITIRGKSSVINAICVPEINVNLKLPGLREISKKFIDCGYVMADSLLYTQDSDIISSVGFVLGTSSAELLPENQVCFGTGTKSLFSLTHAGVLLMGSTDVLLSNLPMLPENTESSWEQSRTNLSVSSFMSCSKDLDDTEICTESNEIHSLSSVVVDNGELCMEELELAAESLLADKFGQALGCNYDDTDDESVESDRDLVRFALDTCDRTDDGRLVFPLLWRKEVAHLLPSNFSLARSILMSNLNKFINKRESLILIDNVFKEQLNLKIIEEITDLQAFMSDNPNHSFLPHMPVFRPSKETTKCRVVFLSNLCERRGESVSVSHNQAINAGPTLNQKISVALTNLRFGECLLCFDVQKAFLQVGLPESDCNRLLFLWFRDVEAGNYELVAYRNLRLSFGLRCSPTLLMLALYKILCLDVTGDSDRIKGLKKLIYSITYMDNGAVTGSLEYVRWAYTKLNEIFNPYKFNLQQIVVNDEELQDEIDRDLDRVTESVVVLFGTNWDRNCDTISPRPVKLEDSANTKRKVLQTIACQYDILNVSAPILNRARIFLHKLQRDRTLSWDVGLSPEQIKEWKKICTQANSSPLFCIRRFVGERDDPYKLIAFCDSSKLIYGVVLYIMNLRTNQISFLCAKNRLVNEKLEQKTIPVLELQAVTLGVSVLMDSLSDLTGSHNVIPITVCRLELYTDSTIALHWLCSYSYKLAKMQSCSVFVRNRLQTIERLCLTHPVKFSHVCTGSNPADYLTRPCSGKILKRSNYHSGPVELLTKAEETPYDITIPNVNARFDTERLEVSFSMKCSVHTREHVVPLVKFNSFEKLLGITVCVLRAVRKFKAFLTDRNSEIPEVRPDDVDLRKQAFTMIISIEQSILCPDVLEFVSSRGNTKANIPDVCNRLNLFLSDSLVRVKSKFDRWKDDPAFGFPIFLPKESKLCEMIINDTHIQMSHSGVYSMLSRLRKQFWIEHIFSKVKCVLKKCILCRRLNGRPVKLNQSSYRLDRVQPKTSPFGYIYLDYLGNFVVCREDKRQKIWLLCLTCMWTRAVNLIICNDLSVKTFLRAFQIHVFQHGLPSKVFSDLGSQIVCGGDIVSEILRSPDVQSYLSRNDVVFEGFEQYSKGNSAMGALVEIVVKLSKRLIFGSVRNLVVDYHDFEVVIAQTKYLLNSRPVSFVNGLRDTDSEDLPSPITPELLITGREIVVTNVVPSVSADNSDVDWKEKLSKSDLMAEEFRKLSSIRARMETIYNEEFLNTLQTQATNSRDRYKPVFHDLLRVGDLILLIEPNMKQSKYPIAIVREIVTNMYGEVTDVLAFKGSTKELVKRHVTSVLKLFRPVSLDSEEIVQDEVGPTARPLVRRGPDRACKNN